MNVTKNLVGLNSAIRKLFIWNKKWTENWLENFLSLESK